MKNRFREFYTHKAELEHTGTSELEVPEMSDVDLGASRSVRAGRGGEASRLRKRPIAAPMALIRRRGGTS
jgi:hypothetical protein